MSENRRTVGGRRHGKQFERASDDAEDEMTTAVTDIAGGSQNATATTAATVNIRVDPLSSSELDSIKDFTIFNLQLIGDLNALLTQKDKKIAELTKQMEDLTQRVNEAQQQSAKVESVNIRLLTAVSSTRPSGMGDSSPTELPEQQEVKQKKRRKRNVALVKPNPDPLEPNETKTPRSRSTRAKSGVKEKTQEVSLITADNEIYKNITNDPTKHQLLIPKIVLEKVIINYDLGTYKVPGSSTIKRFRRYSN